MTCLKGINETEHPVRWISISQIITDVGNVREVTDVGSLVESMRLEGQLQPIIVFQRRDEYIIAAGFRRLAAAKALEWFNIEAKVIDEEHYTESNLRYIMASENQERVQLTPLDEAVMVDQLVNAEMSERCHADIDEHAELDSTINEVAAQLGRSESWVRQRLHLMRLSPSCRRRLATGEILLGHAQELAKLVDHKAQDDILRHIGWHSDDKEARTRVTSVRDVARMVSVQQRTLHGTPWKLDVAFNGCPACSTCVNNTDNAPPALFDDDDDLPAARCLDRRCYETKAAFAASQVTKSTEKLVELKVSPTAKAAQSVTAAAIKPSVVARAAARTIDPTPRKSKPGAVPSKSHTLPQDHIFIRQADEKNRNAAKGLHEFIIEKVRSGDHRVAFLLWVVHCSDRCEDLVMRPYDRPSPKEARAIDARVIKAREIARLALAGDVEAFIPQFLGLHDPEEFRLTDEMVFEFARAAGLKVPDWVNWWDLKAEAEAAIKEKLKVQVAKKTSKKKVTKKKSTKKKVAKVKSKAS